MATPDDSDDASSADSDLITSFHPQLEPRILRNFWRVLIGGLAGFALCVEIYARYLKIVPAPKPPLIGAAALGVVVAYLLPRRRLWAAAEIGREALTLIDVQGNADTLPWKDLRLIAGEAGISFDGGEIIRWKWVRIVTARARFRIAMDQQSSSFYIALLRQSPDAIGISYEGAVHLPMRGARTNPDLAKDASIVEGELRSQAHRVGAWALGALGVSGVGAALLVYGWTKADAKHHEDLAKFSLFVIFAFAAATASAGFAFKRYIGARRVARRLQGTSSLERRSSTPHHWTIPAA